MTSVQVEDNLPIVQYYGNTVSVLFITKVKCNGGKNQTIMLEMLRVDDTWLGKNYFCSAVKLRAIKTGWSECHHHLSVLKYNCHQNPF